MVCFNKQRDLKTDALKKKLFVTISVLTPTGHYLLYRRQRKMLEKRAKTRPRYQDLVAMVLNEVCQNVHKFYITSVHKNGDSQTIAD